MKPYTIAATVAIGALGVSAVLHPLPVQAAGFDCSTFVLANGAKTEGCQLGSTNNDTVGGGILQVNTDQLFGFSNWQFLGKDESGGTLGISPEFPPIAQSGTWNVSSFLPSGWTDALLVFKGGNGNNISPQNYVAYLLKPGMTSGTWSSPFINTKNGNVADISHISLYSRIPTPALLPGLIGMAIATVRKRQSANPSTPE